MKNYKIIGLTGQSGAGKSTVSKMFLEKNCYVINADMLVKKLYYANSVCTKTLASCFGNLIIDNNGTIINKELAKIAFSSEENTKMLNSIVHPFVISEFLTEVKIAKENGYKIIVFDAPQLFESGFDVMCDCIVCVTADKDIRVNRLGQRDCLDKNLIVQRLNAQLSQDYFIKNSDYCLQNNGNILTLQGEFEKIYSKIRCYNGSTKKI